MIVNNFSKGYAQDYIKLKGSSQYPVFLATALGVKDSYDEWIRTRDYDTFVEMCKGYGLHVEPDVLFVSPEDQSDKSGIIGAGNITTTFMMAEPFSKEKNGDVHVFVSRSKETAKKAKRAGWYPMVVNGRLINRPFVDHLRFGKCLGFPDCCVDFFAQYNNWNVYSHPYESFKRTKKPSYYCNNFLMDHAYSYIHHIPCSYDCEKTKAFAKEVEKKLSEVDPEFVKEAKRVLSKPYLIFDERNFIVFDGKLEDSTFYYTDTQYFENLAKPEDRLEFYEDIKRGNNLVVEKDRLVIKKDDETIKTVPKKEEWFAIDFKNE